MKAEDFKNMIREIIREELQSLTNEEKYDSDKDLKAMGYRSWDDYYRDNPEMHPDAPKQPKSTEPPNPRFSQKPYVMPPNAKTLGPVPGFATDKKNMLHQKVKYKDAAGKEHEAFVYSLLKYGKDHPGYKVASRIYAQFMAKNKDRAPKEEQLCEGEGCLDERSVPQPYDRKGARKMTKSQINRRKSIGDAMMRDEKTKSKFRKKYGDDWKSYIWAAASSAAFRQSGSTKSDDKRKE